MADYGTHVGSEAASAGRSPRVIGVDRRDVSSTDHLRLPLAK